MNTVLKNEDSNKGTESWRWEWRMKTVLNNEEYRRWEWRMEKGMKNEDKMGMKNEEWKKE